MRVLVCGDVHLTNYGMFNEPTDDPAVGSRLSYILKALDDFFAYGKENNINTYIINGDLFDSRQSDNPTTLAHIRKHFITSFRNLTNVNKVTLYLNSGNHDQYTRSVNPNSLEDFELYSTDTHRIKVINAVTPIQVDNNTELFFIPYDEDIKGTKEAINDYLYKHPFGGSVNVFAHLGVTGATQGRWNHRLGGAFNLDDLGWNAPNVKSISLSHYHNRQSLKKDNIKDAYYIGDLTALNFNDIGSKGLGVPRGFDEIDLDTGEHKFIDLTQSPYNIPTFNQINLDTDDNFDLATQVDDHSYYKISCKSKDTYEKLAKELENNSIASRVQLILLPQEQRVTIDVDANATDTELVSKYCDLNYPEVKDKALDYLRKAKEAE